MDDHGTIIRRGISLLHAEGIAQLLRQHPRLELRNARASLGSFFRLFVVPANSPLVTFELATCPG